MSRIVVIAFVLALGGCSKKADAPAAVPTGSAAPAAPAAPAATPTAPAAPAGNACAACAKYDACCTALAAIKDSGVNASDCDKRAERCNGTSDAMRGDINSTCAERVADWTKDHPDVAACK